MATKYPEVMQIRLTAEQRRMVQKVASLNGCSEAEVVRNMIDLIVLLTYTDMTFSDVIRAAMPKLGERLAQMKISALEK